MLRNLWPLSFMKRPAGGGGLPMGPYRYWRIKITASSGWALADTGMIGDMEMAETQDGANVCTGGAALSSGEFDPSFVDDNAFDGNVATSWVHEPGDFTNLYLGYDLGSGNDKEIHEVRIRPRVPSLGDGPPYALGAPGAFDVQFSNDGAAWFTGWSVTYPSGSRNNRHDYCAGVFISFTDLAIYADPGTKTRWRILIDDTDGGAGNAACALREVELRATIGGADSATGGTAFACSESNGTAPPDIFDDSTGTIFVTAFGNALWQYPKWMGYEFSGAITINQILIDPRTSFHAQAPHSGKVQSCTDNYNWVDEWSFTFGTWASGVPQTHDRP